MIAWTVRVAAKVKKFLDSEYFWKQRQWDFLLDWVWDISTKEGGLKGDSQDFDLSNWEN